MEKQGRPRIYVIGLDSLTERVIRADVPDADIRRLRPVRDATDRRRGPLPHVVVLDITRTHALRERALVRRSWGAQVVVIGLSSRDPMARVWHSSTTVVELAPGFLAPFLPAPASSHVSDQPSAFSSAFRLAKEHRAVLYPVAAGLITLMNTQLGMVLALYLLVLLLIVNVSRRRHAA
jgi:hypothetical protein